MTLFGGRLDPISWILAFGLFLGIAFYAQNHSLFGLLAGFLILAARTARLLKKDILNVWGPGILTTIGLSATGFSLCFGLRSNVAAQVLLVAAIAVLAALMSLVPPSETTSGH